MTTRNYATHPAVPDSSHIPRNARTFMAQMAAMEARKREEISERVRELRGPRPQQHIADAVGVTLRAYQRWESGGGIAWENLEALAEFHEVDTDYLLNGPRGETPDLSRESQLDRLERKLDALLAANAAAVAEISEPTLREFEAQAEKQPPTAAPPERKPKPERSTTGRARTRSRRART